MMFGSFIHLVASKISALQIAVLIILKFMHFIKKVGDGQVDLEQIEKEKQHDAKKISEIWSADFASAWTHTFIILPGDESRSPKQLQMGETIPNSQPMKQITAPFLDSCGDNAVDADDSKFMRFIKKVGDGQVVSPFLFVLNQHAKKIPEIWSADFASAWTHLILQSMKTFPLLLGIQMAATACLYNLTKGPLSSKIHTKWLNEIVDLTLISMENFPKQPQLQKNSLLTLCSDRMLQDVSFNRYCCAELVMNSLLAFDDPAMNRMSVAICSILTARITTAETSVLGAKEAYMRKLLNIVKSKSEQRDIDIMMKFTLSALWNLSDESPKTCSVFLNLGGMELFLEVLKEHDDFLHQLTSVEDWLYGEDEEQEAVYKERLDELK